MTEQSGNGDLTKPQLGGDAPEGVPKRMRRHVLKASTSDEIDAAFATFVRDRPDGLFVGPDPFFNSRRVQLALMAARHTIPAIYGAREYVEAGGLICYGSNLINMFREVGVYTVKRMMPKR